MDIFCCLGQANAIQIILSQEIHNIWHGIPHVENRLQKTTITRRSVFIKDTELNWASLWGGDSSMHFNQIS